MVTSTGTFVSCKDYDDDIEGLDQKITNLTSDLTSQKESLTSALAAAQSEAAAAKSTAEAAKTEAEKAAALATSAAATAKAEAIEEVMKQVETLMRKTVSAEELATLAGTVDGIQKGLGTLDGSLKKLGTTVDEQAKAIKAMQIQLDALAKFEKATGKDLTSIKGDISTMQSQIANMTSAEDVKKLIKDANDKLTQSLGSEISTLKGVISNRLTSITLVPDLYVDGIETIEFVSLVYQPQVQGGEKGLMDEPGKAQVIVSSDENPANYRLNPTTIDLATDVVANEISFVACKATSRGVVESPIAYVAGSATINDGTTDPLKKGILTVCANKTITSSLNLTGDQIYTVALKVPVAEYLREDKDVPEYVYSEYSRLSESTLNPKIAEKAYACDPAAGHKHYSDSLTIWSSPVSQNQLIAKEWLYNQPLDLRTMVTGCITDDTREITAAELKKYGLEFRFAIPTKAYNTNATNKTDQQQFAQLASDGYTLSSKLPNGVTNNKAAIDKEPIIRVTLWDVNNKNIVDQRYLKIKWADKAVDPVDLGVKKQTSYLGCDAIDMDVTWTDFINTIYGQIKDEKLDMSEEQFHAIYPQGTGLVTTTGNIVVAPGQKGSLSYDNNTNVAGDALVLKWTLPIDDINKIVEYNTNVSRHTYSLVNNVFTCQITFKPTNSDYPVLTYTLENTIELKDVPEINGFYENYWESKYSLYDVYPVQYNSPAYRTNVANGITTCVFDNNLMNAFSFAQYANGDRFIVKNLNDCGTWDMQFCQDRQQNGYAPNYVVAEPDPTTANNIGGYNLMNGTTLAAQLVWPDGHSAWCKNPAHETTNVQLQKNAAGIALLNKTAHIGVWATINSYNMIPVYDYDIKFIEPLNIKASEMEDAFVDGVVSGSRIDWTKCFKMYDCFGYTVAKVTTNNTEEKLKYAAELYKYYEVVDPEWGTANYKIGMKEVAGSVVVDNNLTVDQAMTKTELEALTTGGMVPSIKVEGNELVFYSNMGSQVTDYFNIWIPVTVKYGWGQMTTYVKVKVNAMNNTPVE